MTPSRPNGSGKSNVADALRWVLASRAAACCGPRLETSSSRQLSSPAGQRRPKSPDLDNSDAGYLDFAEWPSAAASAAR